ncbi:pectate lyase-like adhesive domain-containing protein [Lactobacillus sp. R2/2]|nr:pectate lyase-like adhesive domain-containing protein [Lactobacillus sp. R2/2]
MKSSDEDSKSVSKTKTTKEQTKKDSKESDQSTAVKQPDTGANDANAVTPGKTDSTGKDTNIDITSGDNTASDGKLPEDSQVNVIKPGDDTSNNDEQNSNTDKIAPAKNKNPLVKDAGDGFSYQVYNWKDFQDALKNKDITEIILMNDVSANPNNGNNTFDVPGRTLLIRSNGNAKYKLDFTGYSPKQTGRTNADVTYQSLDMRSGDYYGVWNTDNVNGNYHANIMFKDCSFEGSQLIYAGSNTHIFLPEIMMFILQNGPTVVINKCLSSLVVSKMTV